MASSRSAPLDSACTVRIPKPADCARLAELAGQLGYPSTARQMQERLDAMADPDQYGTFVAELPNGQVVGLIGVYIFRAAEVDPFVEISGLVVDEHLRSQGIGRALLDAAEHWARERGYTGISVRSNVVRERAHAFYVRNGFERGKTQATLVKSF